jgi:hypothetical protein
MNWNDYDSWQGEDVDARPERALADGFITGAVVSLHEHPDEYWLTGIVHPASCDGEPCLRAAAQIRHRMDEVREHLAQAPSPYAPTLTVNSEGDLDVTAWATGFVEAIGPDLDMWAYHLSKTEAGLLGLIGSHAIGPVGEAGPARMAIHEDSLKLTELSGRLWEFIPSLVETMYRKKVQLKVAGEC